MLDADGRLLLYDQGNACFYRNRPKQGIQAGIPRLDAVEAGLAALFDMDHKRNHYREFLKDWELVDEWCQRIRQVPDFVIDRAVARIPVHLATPSDEERKRLVEFLQKRKEYLPDHSKRWQDRFPRLPAREAPQP